MLLSRFKTLLILCLIATASPSLFSQKIGFIDSETVRQEFKEAEQAEQKIQSIVNDWKIELEAMQEQINSLRKDIEKNRLIWSDVEKLKNELELEKLIKKKSDYTTELFQPGGEFDKVVKRIQGPVETKIYENMLIESTEE